MFHTDTECSKDAFLEKAKAARQERALEKKKEAASIKIQATIRGWLQRRKFCKHILDEFDGEFNYEPTKDSLKPALTLYKIVNRFLIVWKKERDAQRFFNLCRYLVTSLESDNPKFSYVGIMLNKEHAISWIKQIKEILWKCCLYLDNLSPDVPTDVRLIMKYLHTLIAFTSTDNWALMKAESLQMFRKGANCLCANIMGDLFKRGFYTMLKSLLIKGLSRLKICLDHVSLSAIMTLSLRVLVSGNLTDKLMSMFLIHIFSVPGLMLHLHNLSPECVTVMKESNFLSQSLNFLDNVQDMKIVVNSLEANYTLCLFANILQLAYLQRETEFLELSYPEFVHVMTELLCCIKQYVMAKQSNVSTWHNILGWFSQINSDADMHASLQFIKQQLYLLWSPAMISILLEKALIDALDPEGAGLDVAPIPEAQPNRSMNIFKRVIEARANKFNAGKQLKNKLNNPECVKVALICGLYQTALNTLTQIRLDIITGLCYQTNTLYLLWRFIYWLGPNCGLKSFHDLLAVTSCSAPAFNVLTLFSDCMTHYITILDDIEMYEQQETFRLNDYIIMSSFLNNFLCKGIVHYLFDIKTLDSNNLFQLLHTHLMVLYRRDSRRAYAPPDHWLIKEIKINNFMQELEKGKRTYQVIMQKMPHIIPRNERVQLFRKFVANDKTNLGLNSPNISPLPSHFLIKVHRNRFVEDAYRQLAKLSPTALKGVIRVMFVNEQGLDEAGIDQNGVFKEFLEETIKRVFDPSLNLFRVTSEEGLYPSPTSYMQDNHLQLFEFVGRILGKALYEGIVVDVPFASFFLSQVLGQNQQALYSYMDELPSLDNEMYRSLAYIKHYKGDISDLELTFSLDEDVMGKVVTHELVRGGKVINVTNLNKINYIHMMAHFRMHTQIREQTAAFIRGFRSIINLDWLSLFSAPELQILISGDNVKIDLDDLRKNTHYYGGFHVAHRVIMWLWEILYKDFTEDELKLFLKFVTSCSKPPLLGFAHLQPPFSIRCVEVSDDDDSGDTIGSVIRGFIGIRKKDPQHRLPTSSTCFNLLKLPNYQNKSTLRQKLRYAISSNTGFELS